MKRRDLERKLRIAGCYLKREGSAHVLLDQSEDWGYRSGPTAYRNQRAIGKKNSEEYECRMNVRTS